MPEEFELFGEEHQQDEQARQQLIIQQEKCEHDEEMRQGNGFVYGVCKKCNKDLY